MVNLFGLPRSLFVFFCLDTKESNQRKNQGKHDRSAHFAGPTPHITLISDTLTGSSEVMSYATRESAHSVSPTCRAPVAPFASGSNEGIHDGCTRGVESGLAGRALHFDGHRPAGAVMS